MAEENKVINGAAVGDDDQTAGDSFYDIDQNDDVKVTELTRKIGALEKEKEGLVSENEEMKERVKRLTVEIEEAKGKEEEMKVRLGDLEKEIELSDDDKKVLESIAARAVELETEVSRLQHDLISAMSEGEEANVEIAELKKVLGEKGGRIEVLEREIEGLKKAKAESEKKERELERKIGVLEVRETEDRSRKIRVEEEMKERIDEKDREINGFKKRVEDLVFEVGNNGRELERLKFEKLGVEEVLRLSEERARVMEVKVKQLLKEVEEADGVVSGLKERSFEAVNGTVTKSFGNGDEGRLNLQWPVLAAGSTGIIAVAATVAALIYLRRR